MMFESKEYKSFEYEIHITKGDDWIPEDRGMFYCRLDGLDFRLFETMKEAEIYAKEFIDVAISETPKDVDDLVCKISDCLVWEGYEDCELDVKRTKLLIENFLRQMQ